MFDSKVRSEWFREEISGYTNFQSTNPDDFTRIYTGDGSIAFRNVSTLERVVKERQTDGLSYVRSILVSKPIESSKGMNVDMDIKKCACGSVWCPNCFKYKRAKELSERMKVMKWNHVRLITLTLDRSLFKSAQDAYEQMKDTKALYHFQYNLMRTAGVLIKDWIWFLEWSRDGYPHWHYVIEVDQEGKKGMIGQDKIHHYWDFGRIHENYVTSEKHWNVLSGYYGKHGYFQDKKEGKASQGTLPEWAMKYRKNIRRSGSKRVNTTKKSEALSINGNKVIPDKEEKRKVEVKKRERAEYEVIINKCGKSVILDFIIEDKMIMNIRVNVPYKEILNENKGGRFVVGQGYAISMSKDEMIKMCEKYQKFAVPLDRDQMIYKYKK